MGEKAIRDSLACIRSDTIHDNCADSQVLLRATRETTEGFKENSRVHKLVSGLLHVVVEKLLQMKMCPRSTHIRSPLPQQDC